MAENILKDIRQHLNYKVDHLEKLTEGLQSLSEISVQLLKEIFDSKDVAKEKK